MLRKGLSILFGLFLITGLACNLPAPIVDIAGTALPGSTWYASTSGNDSNDCHTPATPCLTIAGALAKARDGGLVVVGPGTFPEAAAGVPGRGLYITKSVIVQGDTSGGSLSTIIDGQHLRTPVEISAYGAVRVAINSVIIQNGGGPAPSGLVGTEGSGLLIEGGVDEATGAGLAVTLNTVIIQNNEGSGVVTSGGPSVSLVNTQISGNAQSGIDNRGGTMRVSGGSINGNHPGILNKTGAISLNETNVSDNNGAEVSGILNQASLSISNSTIRNNGDSACTACPKAIENSGSLSVTATTVSGNPGPGIYNAGGEVDIQNSTFTSNSPAIHNDSGTVRLDYSTITGSISRPVPGPAGFPSTSVTYPAGTICTSAIDNYDVMTVTETTIEDGGSADPHCPGGGINDFMGEMTVSGSTISGNFLGVETWQADLTLTNSTVSGNTIGINAGGSGDLTLLYSTVAWNQLGVHVWTGEPVMEFDNTIIENNSERDCSVSSVIGLVGHNLSDGTCEDFHRSTREAADPYLGPLADNGGPTKTVSLLAGSDAIDHASGDCPAADQRGVARPFDRGCDIGAYEYSPEDVGRITIPLVDTPTSVPTLTLVPVPTLNTPTTTLLLVLDKNANCRRGPGTVYSVLTSVLAGQTVELSGRNEENTWWFTVLPGNNRCWISMVAGQPDGDPMLLPILQAPPTPVPTQADSGCSQYQSVADCTAAGCSWNMNQNACH